MNSNAMIISSLLLAIGTTAVADEIILKRSVRIRHDGHSVVLADVATIEGEHAMKHADLVVATFEDPTRPLELAIGDIEAALERAGANRARFDLTGNKVVIRPFAGRNPATGGPAACMPLTLDGTSGEASSTSEMAIQPVETQDQEVVLDPRIVLAEDTARGLIAERLLAGMAREEGPMRMRISIQDPKILAARERRPSLVGTGRADDGSIGFRIMLDGVFAGTALATVETKMLVYRTRGDMKRGERVDVDDVSVRSEWILASDGDRRSRTASMIGSTLDTRVDADTILESTHFSPVIRRNMPIKVRSGGSGWSMMLDCIALEEGRPGDTIMVRSDTPGIRARDIRPIRVVVENADSATLVN